MSEAEPNSVRGWGFALALCLFALARTAWGQGSIVFTQPTQPMYYSPAGGSYTIDIDGDGAADYVLLSDISGAYLAPQGNNGVIWDGNNVAAINQGDIISSSPSALNPYYAWFTTVHGPNVAIGGQAVFDGQYFYSGNFSGKDAFIGLRFQSGGNIYFGWIEVANNVNIASGQVLGWAYETTPGTPIVAGQVPEPSTVALVILGGGVGLWIKRRSVPCQRCLIQPPKFSSGNRS